MLLDIKGTTRDVLSNEFIFDGKKFEIFDTAGQRSKQGKIEKFGYKKAQKISKEIDHFLILIDKNTKKIDIKQIIKDFLVEENYTHIETKSDQYQYNQKILKLAII